jgi:hypothetical protein
MTPLARAHLLLADGTVIGKYPEVLLHKASYKPLLKYMQQKNAWNESTLQLINREAHANAINGPLSHTLTLLRFCIAFYQHMPKLINSTAATDDVLCAAPSRKTIATSYDSSMPTNLLGKMHFSPASANFVHR